MEASRFLSASCAIKQADRLLYSIQAHNGDGDPYWLSDSGILFAIEPGCIQKHTYGEMGFNPELSHASISWRVSVRDRSVRDEQGFQHTLRDMHYHIRCRKDGKSVYHSDFVEKDGRESHLSDLTLSETQIQGWVPEKSLFEDSAITDNVGRFLAENASDGVADLASIRNGLREFRSMELKRHPLQITPDSFAELVMKEVRQRVNPQYADMVRFRTDGSAIYLQMPGQRDVNILVSNYYLLPRLPKLYQDFRSGNRSLGEIREMILNAVDNEVGDWTGFDHLYDWQAVRDKIVPVKVDQNVLNRYTMDALHTNINNMVWSRQRDGDIYVFRIYPFRKSQEYGERFFLLTSDITDCWDVKVNETLDRILDESVQKKAVSLAVGTEGNAPNHTPILDSLADEEAKPKRTR